MTSEPHSGECHLCGAQIIEARLLDEQGIVILDPPPREDGPYRSHLGMTGLWIAWPVVDDPYDTFRGSRRREHTCRDLQLELGEEADA